MWGVGILAPVIKRIFNNPTQSNFPTEWTTTFSIPFYKSGDINIRSNYLLIVEESVTRFGLHKSTFDICIYSRKEILFLLYLSMSFFLIEIGLTHVKVL